MILANGLKKSCLLLLCFCLIRSKPFPFERCACIWPTCILSGTTVHSSTPPLYLLLSPWASGGLFGLQNGPFRGPKALRLPPSKWIWSRGPRDMGSTKAHGVYQSTWGSARGRRRRYRRTMCHLRYHQEYAPMRTGQTSRRSRIIVEALVGGKRVSRHRRHIRNARYVCLCKWGRVVLEQRAAGHW